jgi:hypothetical protein
MEIHTQEHMSCCKLLRERLNIPDLFSNSRGACMIQGSVSIDNEISENYTMILPGMQHKLREWWGICIARG